MNVPNQMAVVIKFVRIIQEVSAVRASMASCYNQTGKHAKVRANILLNKFLNVPSSFSGPTLVTQRFFVTKRTAYFSRVQFLQGGYFELSNLDSREETGKREKELSLSPFLSLSLLRLRLFSVFFS